MTMTYPLTATTRGAASTSLRKTRDYGKPRSRRGLDKINRNGLDPFQEFLVDHECDSIILKHVIIFFRLIQSHGQGRPGSSALR